MGNTNKTKEDILRIIALEIPEYMDTDLEFDDMILQGIKNLKNDINKLRAMDGLANENAALPILCVSGSFCARGITPKMKEAEEYVRYYIKMHEKPPTYKLVALNLGIGRTAAFARLRHCRELMAGRQ